MLYYKNGRFYVDLVPRRLSYAIPDGCWACEPEVGSRHDLSVYTEDMETLITFQITNGDGVGPEEQALNYFDSARATEPVPITVNGLSGYSVVYRFEKEAYHRETYWIALLDISSHGLLDELDDCIARRMEIIVSTSKDNDLNEVLNSREVQEALKSIRID